MPLTRHDGADDLARRKRNLLLIGGALMLIVAATVFEVGTRTSQLPFASNLIVFALFNLNLVVLLLLLVLLFRNLIKLSFERRNRVIGSRFKTKLVLTYLTLALAPGILIFIIASNFITTSIEGWFKPQVERPLDQAMEVAQTYYQTQEATALRHARSMARAVRQDGLLDDARRAALAGFLAEQQDRLAVSLLAVLGPEGQEVAHVKSPGLGSWTSHEVNRAHVTQALEGQEITTTHELEQGDMVQGVVPIRGADERIGGAMIVGIHVPQRLESRLRDISQAFQ
jgi:two-component system nitrogen regulation sensor histidine kinase NtrY